MSKKSTQVAGFTLIEMIVVVFIIAVVSAVMVPRFFGNPAIKSISRETEKLSTLIHLAREEASFEGRDYASGFSDDGYSFYLPSEGQSETPWTAISVIQDRMLGQRKLPAGHTINVSIEDLDIDLEEELPENPHVFILSSGETTPFNYMINYADTEGKTLGFDALGRVRDINEDE